MTLNQGRHPELVSGSETFSDFRMKIFDCFFAGNIRPKKMKKLIRDYAAFNTWANDRICSEIISLSEEAFLHEMKSSFKNICETFRN